MACFPRIFNRQKQSFNPAEDDNTDTLLNSSENGVQIGRYVRREETPVFTPKSSEHSIYKQQQRTQFKHNSPQPQGERPNSNSYGNSNTTTFNNNNNSNSNGSNIASNSQKFTNNVSNGTKKFISNKQQSSNSNSNNISSSSLNNKHIINSHNSYNSNNAAQHLQSKLKPVKARRPTALPSEAPNLYIEDDDGADGDDAVPLIDHDVAKTLANAIANDAAHDVPADNVTVAKVLLNGLDVACNGMPATADNNTQPSTPTTQGVKFFIGQQDSDVDSMDEAARASTAKSTNNLKQINEVDAANKTVPTTPSTPRPKFSTQTSIDSSCSSSNFRGVLGSLPKHSSKTKFPSNASNKQQRKTRSGSAPEEVLNIPPPPPLPPHMLTTAASTASLGSLTKKSRAKRQSRHETSTDGSGGIQARNNSKDDRASNKHLDGRDSGVQFEDAAGSQNDSDSSSSTKSHRVEGGLIFTRSNLPVRKDVDIEYIEKDENTRTLIRTAIENNDFLNNYMDKERKEMVIDAMEPAAYEQDSFIIIENEEGSEIFVSEEGYFDVIKAGKVIGTLGPATLFGELAILYNAKRFASIKATTYARVWKIDREKFRNIMVISGSRERQENLNFLRSAPFLQELGEEVLDKVVDLLQRKFYETNTCIVREGEVGNEFFIIRGGTVTIKKRNEYDVERVVDRRKRGEYFGEQALLNADRRQASVYADAPGTECLKLDREAFISYLGTIPQLRAKPVERGDPAMRVSHRKSEFVNAYANVGLKELKKIATLGAGAFGRVDLVAYKDKTFALKIIKKIDIIKQDQVDHVYSEKHVMMKCSQSPFIIELFKTFRNEKFVYFLMEACMGGDVWTIMSQRRFFDEKTARFIAGCVVEAFDFLHSHNIIYRDLKPENLMLTTDGYCKLVDFGFAKYVPPNQKTNTFAGTPEYVAPEIILDRGHDRSVDYWALGILIFELLVGKTPFRGQNQIKIYQQILGGIDVIRMPSQIPKSAQGLIKHLCKQLPVERLGYQRKGILDIKRHSWFDSLDWNKLKAKQLNSPIKRPITSNTDTQYFGPCGAENDQDPPDETSGWDIDF